MNQLGFMALMVVLTILTSCNYEHTPYIEGDLNQEHEAIEDDNQMR